MLVISTLPPLTITLPPLCRTPTSPLLKALSNHSQGAPCPRQHTAELQGQNASSLPPLSGRPIKPQPETYRGLYLLGACGFSPKTRRELPGCSKWAQTTSALCLIKCSVIEANFTGLWWHPRLRSGLPSHCIAFSQSPISRIQLLQALLRMTVS